MGGGLRKTLSFPSVYAIDMTPERVDLAWLYRRDSVRRYLFEVFDNFLVSEDRRRSIFLMSSLAGSASGRMPRCPRRSLTPLLFLCRSRANQAWPSVGSQKRPKSGPRPINGLGTTSAIAKVPVSQKSP